MNYEDMIIKRQLGERGQVVIPKDIRQMLGLHSGESVVFEVKNDDVRMKKEEDVKEFLKRFFSIARSKKSLTLKDLKKIEEESYDLP